MPLASSGKRNPRLAVFDLNRALIDSRPAWRYAIEESVISVTGKRVSAGPLVEEYHQRPWRHALGILVRDPEEANRCEALCVEMHGRSAMKRLLVFEGIGMALDALRAERIDMAGVTRLAHRTAMKQVQSTGLDRFLAYVAAPHGGEAFGFEDLFRACCDVLESGASPGCGGRPGRSGSGNGPGRRGGRLLSPLGTGGRAPRHPHRGAGGHVGSVPACLGQPPLNGPCGGVQAAVFTMRWHPGQ